MDFKPCTGLRFEMNWSALYLESSLVKTTIVPILSQMESNIDTRFCWVENFFNSKL